MGEVGLAAGRGWGWLGRGLQLGMALGSLEG